MKAVIYFKDGKKEIHTKPRRQKQEYRGTIGGSNKKMKVGYLIDRTKKEKI